VAGRCGPDRSYAGTEAEDRHDAQFPLKLMMEDRFPRLCVGSVEDRNLKQLLWHLHRLVQMRTRILNQLQAVARNEGIQGKGGLRSKQGRKRLEQLQLAPWARRRSKDLLELPDPWNQRIEGLSAAVQQEAEKRSKVRLLMTHPVVGPVTALTFALIVGYPELFQCGKQIRFFTKIRAASTASGGEGHSARGSLLNRFTHQG
jgi:transposase